MYHDNAWQQFLYFASLRSKASVGWYHLEGPLTETDSVLALDHGYGAVAGAGACDHVSLGRVADAEAVVGKDETEVGAAQRAVAVVVDVEAAVLWTVAPALVVREEAFLQGTHSHYKEMSALR